MLCSIAPLASKGDALSLEASIKNWSKPKTFHSVCKRLGIQIKFVGQASSICLPDTHERRLKAVALFAEIRHRVVTCDEAFSTYKWVRSLEAFPGMSVRASHEKMDASDVGNEKLLLANTNFLVKWSIHHGTSTVLRSPTIAKSSLRSKEQCASNIVTMPALKQNIPLDEGVSPVCSGSVARGAPLSPSSKHRMQLTPSPRKQNRARCTPAVVVETSRGVETNPFLKPGLATSSNVGPCVITIVDSSDSDDSISDDGVELVIIDD